MRKLLFSFALVATSGALFAQEMGAVAPADELAAAAEASSDGGAEIIAQAEVAAKLFEDLDPLSNGALDQVNPTFQENSWVKKVSRHMCA